MTETPDQRTRRILRENNLPEGLLPSGMVRAHIGADGRFELVLPKRVERKHGGYRVRFGPTIAGVLTDGKVRQLTGVEAKQLMWFAVSGITLTGDTLGFHVGPAVVPLPKSAFP